MSSSSPNQFVLDTIITALQTEPQFNVIRVWKADAYESTRITCYPYISSVQYRNEMENNTSSGYSIANVEIICQCIIESDPSGSGIAQERASMIAMLAKHAIESFDLDSLDANTDMYFTTKIVAMTVDGNTGTFNVNDNRIQLGISSTIWFHIA